MKIKTILMKCGMLIHLFGKKRDVPQFVYTVFMPALAFFTLLIIHGDAYAQIYAGQSGQFSKYSLAGATISSITIPYANGPTSLALSGTNLYVLYKEGTDHLVGVYNTSGEVINPELIREKFITLSGLAVSGTDLYLISSMPGPVIKYNTSGLLINSSLTPDATTIYSGIAISGTNLFLTDWQNGKVAEYTTSGAVVNASLISGLSYPLAIAVSGSDIFVSDNFGFNVGRYNISGSTINTSIIQSQYQINSLAVLDDDLFVNTGTVNTIGEYTFSGTVVKAPLVWGFGNIYSIAVAAEPAKPPIDTNIWTFSGLWDISGSYSGEIEPGFSLHFNLSNDWSGKLVGTGMLNFDNGAGVAMYGDITISGVLKASGGVTRVSLTALLTSDYDPSSGEPKRISHIGTLLKLGAEIDGANGRLVFTDGSINLKVFNLELNKRSAQSIKLGIPGPPGYLDFPSDVNGCWNLSLNMTPVGSKSTGSATINTSTGGKLNMIASGSYSPKTGNTSIKLKGTGCSANLVIATSGTNTTFKSVIGKMFGQTIKYFAQ